MATALKLPPHRMTVDEFLKWSPEDGSGAVWQLRDGVPEMMAPASDAHGSIQFELAHLLNVHLSRTGSRCGGVIAPGVIPPLRSERNMSVPNIGITSEPPSGGRSLPNPVVLIEILSPSNEAETRASVAAYATISSVAEIVVVDSTRIAAEVLRRGPDGAWPGHSELVGTGGELRLDSIGFAIPLRAAYRTSGIA